MSFRQAALFLFVGLITVAAQLAMKKGVSGITIQSAAELLSPRLWLRPWLFGSLVLYALSAALYVAMLSQLDVGRLYPSFLGLCITLVAVGSVAAGLESFSWFKAAGVMVIIAGIALMHQR